MDLKKIIAIIIVLFLILFILSYIFIKKPAIEEKQITEETNKQDIQNYNQIVSEKSLESCDKLINPIFQSSCKNDVMTEKAVTSNDISQCKEDLGCTNRYYTSLAIKNKDVSYCNKLNDIAKSICTQQVNPSQISDADKMLQDALIAKDISLCNEDLSCTNRYYTSLAIQTKDPSYCNKLNDIAKGICLQQI